MERGASIVRVVLEGSFEGQFLQNWRGVSRRLCASLSVCFFQYTAPSQLAFIISCSTEFLVSLGFLDCIRSADTSGVETSFHVYINVIDRSIWLVLAPYELNGIGERATIPRGTDPWPFLGLRSNGRVHFDVMELMTWNEFLNLKDL